MQNVMADMSYNIRLCFLTRKTPNNAKPNATQSVVPVSTHLLKIEKTSNGISPYAGFLSCFIITLPSPIIEFRLSAHSLACSGIKQL